MDKVRVGIIGCGAFARSEHLPNCERNPNIEIAWACSRSQKNRDYATEHYTIQNATPDASVVMKDDSVDMVILSVPHSLHLEMIEAAAKAGKHILCEKPMAMSIEESCRIVRAVQSSGVKLCVDYNRRFAPSMQHLKREYLSHRANPTANPGAFVNTPGRRPLPEEDVSMVMVRINDESSTYRPVHMDWGTGGGQVIGESCHWLDLVCWLLEDVPVRIYATGWTRLSHIITLDFEAGHRACIFFSCNGTFNYPKELYEILDHAALFRNECFVETAIYGRSNEPEVKVWPFQFDDFPDVGTEGGLSGYIAKCGARAERYIESRQTNYGNLAPNKGHYELLDAFVGAIMNDEPSPLDEVAGARATYLSRRAIESIRLGKPLPINVEDYDFFVW